MFPQCGARTMGFRKQLAAFHIADGPSEVSVSLRADEGTPMKAVKLPGIRRIRLLALAVAVAAISAAPVVAAGPAHAQASRQPLAFARRAAAPAASLKVKMRPTPAASTLIATGSSEAMQRAVQAELAANQASAAEPSPARNESAAIPAIRARSASRPVPRQPGMEAAAAAVPQEPTTADRAAALGTPDTGLDALWNDYGNSANCADWSGGDGTDSVALPDGDRAWFFSDTYLGSPAARKTLFYASTLHNSIVIQQRNSLRTITGGNTCQEKNTKLSFWDRYAITPANAPSGEFYWTGDQMLVGSNIVKFYYSGNHSEFPFAIGSSAVATIPVSALEHDTTTTITPRQFTDLCVDTASGTSDIIWGSALLSWNGNVYVYGWSSTTHGLLYLAKTTAADLTDPSTWSTFAGLSKSGSPVWSRCGAQITPLSITYGSGLSVTAINGRLWLVQQDPGAGLVGGPIAAHPAAAPWLFNNDEVVLYYPPEETHTYPYYYLTYGAQVQAGLAASSSYYVISYNVNSTAVDTGCISADIHGASIYRPRFIDVPASAFSTSALTAEAKSSGTTLPAPVYGLQDYGPADPAPAPAIDAAVISPTGSGGSIDGATDWYDQWGQQLDGKCPGLSAPSTLTAAPPTPGGQVTLTWPTVGTDVWFWGYQADQTAKTGFLRMWGGLWAEPSSASAKTVSKTAAPVTSASTNGDVYAWYVTPFGAGDHAIIGPVPIIASPTASEVVRMQPPSAPTLVSANHGSGAEAEFNVTWNDVTYPSSAVYYWVYYWDVTAGQTEADASVMPDPAPPGTTNLDIEGLTPDNRTTLAPDSEYGFYVKAENLGGYSPPSSDVLLGPTPVCAFDVLQDAAGQISVTAGQVFYFYVESTSNLPGDEAQVITVTNLNTGSNATIVILPIPYIGVVAFQDTVDPPISYKLLYNLQADVPIAYTVTSDEC